MKINKRKEKKNRLFSIGFSFFEEKNDERQTKEINLNRFKCAFLSIIFLTISGSILGQDVNNIIQYRAFGEVKYKVVKHLNIYISPEFRFDESFSLDKYHIEVGASYKISKIFSLGANYRLIVNPREIKETEHYSRFNVYAKLKQKWSDFTPSIRLSYANFADDDTDNDLQNYLRYKADLEYDIPKCKVNPKIGVEAFHNLSNKEISKIRYMIGADYKLFKKNYLSFKYKMDYFRTEYTNKHIFELGYKIKL